MVSHKAVFCDLFNLSYYQLVIVLFCRDEYFIGLKVKSVVS